QPVLLAISIASLAQLLPERGWSNTQRTAILIGITYMLLYLLAAIASRKAHRVSELAGSEHGAAKLLWCINLFVFIILAIAGWLNILFMLVLAFIAIHVLQNLWRPILISRFDEHGSPEQGATILSIESQSRRVATMIFAPLIGYAVDTARLSESGGSFWPIGVLGVIVALGMVLTGWGRNVPDVGTKTGK
ncbi:MAG: hypothetical protein O7G85_12590, partial [Planctomycetota bacterium]|nr:hypothetical protein [Planctomycetota bacterium]